MSDKVNGPDSFVVFGRKDYQQPLEELGSVSAANSSQAGQAALEAYPDDDWLEMIAVPQQVVVPVISGSHMAKDRDYE